MTIFVKYSQLIFYLFDFIFDMICFSDEYFKKNAEAASTWDITRKTDADDSVADSKFDDSPKMDCSGVLDESVGGMDESIELSAIDVDINHSGNVPGKCEELSAKDVDVNDVVNTGDAKDSQTTPTEDEDERIKQELREAEPDFDKKFRWVTK